MVRLASAGRAPSAQAASGADATPRARARDAMMEMRVRMAGVRLERLE